MKSHLAAEEQTAELKAAGEEVAELVVAEEEVLPVANCREFETQEQDHDPTQHP